MTGTPTPGAPAPSPPSANMRPKNIIAVASGKGGVGKTWFSVTLAHALALTGARTLLFDGDLGLANLDIQLGLMPKYDLGGVIAGRLTLDQAVSTFDAGGFDVVTGRSGSGGLANVQVSRLQVLSNDLGLLSAHYDRVIVDLGAGVEKTVRSLISGAERCVILATDEPTSLTDAYAFIKITHMERPDINISIVINMANSAREGERTYNTLLKACEGFLKVSPELLGIVRRDSKVREAIRSQTSILTRFPNSQAAEDVVAIAAKLRRP